MAPPTARPTMPLMPRIVIAGGGVAALEACLALRERLDAEALDVTLLTPATRFEYRPLAVLEPFAGISRWSLALERFAADQGVELVNDALVAVAPNARVAVSGAGDELAYDLLLIATGGRAADAIHGALTFRGPAEGRHIRALLADPPASLAFAAPAGASWPLPVYELACLVGAQLRRAGATTALTVVTPEAAPLALFGARASEFIGRELARHGIALVTDADAIAARDGGLELRDGRRVEAERVIALPRVLGRRIEGVPHDGADFVVVDAHCRVPALPHVYAAGDVTNLPFKHGGFAAQQADVAAAAMLAELGEPIVARALDPVLEAVLFTDDEAGSEWPPTKIASRRLTPYLARVMTAGAARQATDGAGQRSA
jgi:sulfide:quinone oxidoreductase